MFTWIHISDIHFGHGDRAYQENQKAVLDALRRDLGDVHRNLGLSPNAIFVTGDIGFSGNTRSADEYSRARDWLHLVRRLFGLKNDDVYIIPGNHDVQRNVADNDRDVMRFLNDIRKNPRQIDDILNNPGSDKDRSRLTDRLRNYLEFAKEFAPYVKAPASASVHPTGLFWRDTLNLPNGLNIRLIGLNTALLSQNDKDRYKLALGETQLNFSFENINDEIVIVMSHHPFDWLHKDEVEEVTARIGRLSDVHLCGHIHDQSTWSSRAGSGTGIVRIVAGAAHSDLKDSKGPRHAYNWASIKAGMDGAVNIEVLPRYWVKSEHDFKLDSALTAKDSSYASHTFLPKTRLAEHHSSPKKSNQVAPHNHNVLSSHNSHDLRSAEAVAAPSSLNPDENITAKTPAPKPFKGIPLPVKYVSRGRKKNINEGLLKLLRRKLAPAKEATLFVLTGAGGVGKTATAQEAIKPLARRYENRILWIGARERESSIFWKLIDEINRRFNPGNPPHPDPENRKLKARQLLEQAPTLIVIDDFETVPADEQGWIDWIEPSDPVNILLISRDASIVERVEHIADREDVDDMTESEAKEFWARLVKRWARHPHIFANVHPEEVIKRVRTTNPFILFRGVFTYVNRVGDWDSVDNALYGSEVEQRIFRRSFELKQVGDHGRRVLMALSLFQNPAPRKVLAFVAGLENDSNAFTEAVKGLLDLWLVKLVDYGRRLTLDGTYRRYAMEHMNSQPYKNELQGRFVQHFVDYVEAHPRTNAEDLNAIEEEKDNIFEAMNIAYTNGDLPSVTQIFAVLGRPHNGFFELRGYWEAAIRYGELAVAAATALGQEKKNLLARFTYTTADFHAKRGEYEEAKRLLQPLVTDGGTSLDKQSYINALHFMGMLEFREHRYKEAEELFRQELVVSKSTGDGGTDLRGIANSTHELGRIARLQGDFEKARTYYEESLKLREQLKNDDGSDDIAAVKSTLHELGLLAHKQGELEQFRHGNHTKARELYEKAASSYERALIIKEKLGNKGSLAHTWTEQADLIRLQAAYESSAEEKKQAYQKARTLLMKSLQINEEIPDLLDIAYTNYILGRVALDEGNVDEAQQLCTRALEIWTRYKDEAAIAGCSYLAGLIAERLGDRGKAAELFQTALDAWQNRGLIAAEYARAALNRVSDNPS